MRFTVVLIPQRFRSANAILALTALIAGSLAFWGATRYVELRARLVEQRLSKDYVAERIVVAGVDLPAGKALEVHDMAARAVPVRFASSDRIPAENAAALTGRRMSHAVRKGDALGWSQLESQDAKTLSARLETGQRAITFPVDDVNSFSGLLTPGDSIDLLYSTRDDAHAAQVVTLLQAVRVLATGKLLRRRRIQDAAGQEREVAAEFVTVTLHVSPDAAARIVLAQQTGELTAVLRNGADQQALRFTRWNSRSLLAEPRATLAATPETKPGNYMELILGGVGAGVAATRRVPVLELAAVASTAGSGVRQ